MQITVLALEGCTPIAPVGAAELLRKAAEIHAVRTGSTVAPYTVELVGGERRDVLGVDGTGIVCARTLAEVDATDVLILPAIEFDVDDKLARHQGLLAPIRRLHAQGTRVASICTGAFLLAATGLLEGREATTHWAMADTFRARFPGVRLRDERIVVDHGDVLMSGGATSFMSLVLVLVENILGKDTAVAASKMLLIDYAKPEQSAYAMFQPQMRHRDDGIRALQELVHDNPSGTWSIADLARRGGMSTRSLVRRWHAATGEAPQSYLQRLRVEHAKRLLESTARNVDEIAADLGYRDVPSFRRLFVRHTGFTPTRYRARYQPDRLQDRAPA